MSVRNILMAAAGAQPSLNVADVFSAYPYSGTGAAQSLSPGVDLSTYGGLFWSKTRTAVSTVGHRLFDSERGNNYLDTSSDSAQTGSAGVSLTTSGVNLTSAGSVNASGYTYIGWMFRKAPKFFDVVTYTGNGAASRSIAHSLGIAPGMIIVKRTDTTANWVVWHRSLSTDTALLLQLTLGAIGVSAGTFSSVGASSFSVGHPSNQSCNESGASYVAYLFAHDPSADGIIQCGSFTTDGIGNATVNHGWAKGVQFALLKASSTTGDWEMFDTARTAGWSGSDARLHANLSDGEDSVSRLSASGTSVSFTGLTAGATYIYMFIVNP